MARRLLAALVLAVVIPLGSPVVPPVAAEDFQPAGAVTWAVDHKARTITVTVKLAFYSRGCPALSSCPPPSAADIGRIKAAISDMWNTGLKVKCYTFSVEIDARAVGSQAEAGPNSVDVGLDYSPVAIRAFVAATVDNADANGKTDALGNTPGDRLQVSHSTDSPTRWPAYTYAQTYAHEFGHILGLDDNYQEGTALPKPGTSDDLMFRKQGDVTPEMVKRAVERSGQVKLEDLQCGWSINADTPLGKLRGTKCDGLGGDWTVKGNYDLAGYGDVSILYNVTMDATTLAGTYHHEEIQILGPTVTTKKQNGKATMVVASDGSVALTLEDAPATLHTDTPAGSKTVIVPDPGRTFQWQPAADGVCP
jgi:hypothetical protein